MRFAMNTTVDTTALVCATLTLCLFGAFLVFAGMKMWLIADPMPDVANNRLLKFFLVGTGKNQPVVGGAA